MKRLKFWWLRIWTLRKEKFKMDFDSRYKLDLGATMMTVGHEGHYIEYIHLGRGYFVSSERFHNEPVLHA